MESNTQIHTSSLCWDIYVLICLYDWKLIPKLMRTCRTLYNRLKPLLYKIAATIPPTVYEQRKYIRETLLPKLIEQHKSTPMSNRYIAHYHLYREYCIPLHVRLITNENTWILSFLSFDTVLTSNGVSTQRLETIENANQEVFMDLCTEAINKYLVDGYQLQFECRCKSLSLRPNTAKQNTDIVMRMLHQQLQKLLGCSVAEYLVKHPTLDPEINRNVHMYLNPGFTMVHERNSDVYDTLVWRMRDIYYPNGLEDVDLNVSLLLEKMKEHCNM